MDEPKLLASAGMGFKPTLVMASARLVDGASADVRIRFDDPALAASTATALQTQLGPAAMFFDELSVTDEDADLVVKMRMSSSQFDVILGMMLGAVGP
jgi:hypothetical protein